MAEKGPTFLNAYVIPVLVLNLAVGGWTLVARIIITKQNDGKMFAREALDALPQSGRAWASKMSTYLVH